MGDGCGGMRVRSAGNVHVAADLVLLRVDVHTQGLQATNHLLAEHCGGK